MNTTELLKDALDWADKRLKLLNEPITETQRDYIEFALRQNLVKNITVTHSCKSDSELLKREKCNMCNEEKDCQGHAVCEDCGGRSF